MSTRLTSQLTFNLLAAGSVTVVAAADNPNAQVSVTVSGLGFYSNLSVVRVVNSVEYPLRGATNIATNGVSSYVTFDFEAPLDTAVSYRAYLDGSLVVPSNTVTIVTDGRTFWLKDVVLGSFSCKVYVEAMSEITRPANVVASFKVIGRANPIIVTDVRQGRTGTMTLTALTVGDQTALNDILASGNTLLFQCPATANFPDMYFQPGDIIETWRGTMSNPIHSYAIPFTETDAPSQQAFTLASNSWLLVTQFSTWQDVLDKRSEWTDVLLSPFSDSDL